MRGLFTAGVLDVLMERGIEPAHTVGVSAGAAFGCNVKSRQQGRAIRYNKRFCADARYAGWGNLLRTGDLYSVEFAYRTVPLELDPFDTKAFRENPARFTVVATDIDTGEAVYRDVRRGDVEDLDWIRASASIPLLARPVELAGRKLLDGGIADSIPVRWMLGQGYRRTVVVLTQPRGYRKEPNRLMPLLRAGLHRYPKLLARLADRHLRYNETLDAIERLEREGRIFVVRPSETVAAPVMVRDPEVLERIYQVGRRDAAAQIAALEAYLGPAGADEPSVTERPVAASAVGERPVAGRVASERPVAAPAVEERPVAAPAPSSPAVPATAPASSSPAVPAAPKEVRA